LPLEIEEGAGQKKVKSISDSRGSAIRRERGSGFTWKAVHKPERDGGLVGWGGIRKNL